MTTLLAALTLVVGLAILWTGLRKLSWATPLHGILSTLDLLALALALWQLGWIGAVLSAIANVLGLVGWTIKKTIEVEAEMSSAAAHSGYGKDEMQALAKRLQREPLLRAFGPRRRARLIRHLAQRARSPQEIAHMAPALGALWINGDRPDLGKLAEDIDAILRLYDMKADDTMRAADQITTATIRTPATQADYIEALIAARS